MLLGVEALRSLERQTTSADRTASSYWRREAGVFSVDSSGAVRGATVLGIITRPGGIAYSALHWLLQTPLRFVGRRFANFAKSERLGRAVARRMGRVFTEDMMRQTLVLALVRHHVRDLPPGMAIAVIGDGFGVLSSLMHMAYPDRRIIVVNLTKPLLVDLFSIQKVFPDTSFALLESGDGVAAACRRPDVSFLGVRADEADLIADAPIGLALNVESMQEMDPPVIAAYFDRLRRCPTETTYFYCCNKREKGLYDGTVVRFADYPFASTDRILVDGACPWSRISYSTRPPFYIVRPPGTMRHRLVALGKSVS